MKIMPNHVNPVKNNFAREIFEYARHAETVAVDTTVVRSIKLLESFYIAVCGKLHIWIFNHLLLYSEDDLDSPRKVEANPLNERTSTKHYRRSAAIVTISACGAFVAMPTMLSRAWRSASRSPRDLGSKRPVLAPAGQTSARKYSSP